MQVTNTCRKQERKSIRVNKWWLIHGWTTPLMIFPACPLWTKQRWRNWERRGENMPTAIIISCQLNAHTVWEAFIPVAVTIPHRALRSVSALSWESGLNLRSTLNICRWDKIHSVSKYKHLFKLTRTLSVCYKQHQQHNAVCEASANINY